ncbi:MAG: PspC domain-containing protein [Chloroflexota bacterium]|nr:PspC domain-containing protein [Chloroflexota bacterium]
MDTRLTRSHTDRMLTGVAGGMAEYFDIDPVIIRLLWVLGAVFTGGVLLVVYFVMAIIMPAPPDDEYEYEDDE